MDLGSTFLVLALLILIGLYITRPFFEKQAGLPSKEFAQEGEAEHQRSSLLAERDRLLTKIQELDFDNALGKIPEEEYPEQRKILLLQGVDILKQLDGIQEKAADEAIEARLEAVIAARRADAARTAQTAAASAAAPVAVAPVAAPEHDDEIERMISTRRQERKELSSGFCYKCGKPIQKSDVFCPKCGAKLS